VLPRTPVRSLDAARYAETFAALVARSREYAPMIDRLVELAAARPEGFSCLDVGAGPGMVVHDWMGRSARRPARYVAVEPNPSHAGPLRRTLAALGIGGEVIEQSFHPGFPIPGTFDLALFSHSIYFMDDPAGCLRRAHEALNPGGVVVAFLAGPLGMFPFVRLFEPLFDRGSMPCLVHPTSSHELVQDLRAAGFEPRVELDDTGFDLTGLFDAEARHERDEFVSFCLQVEFAELPEPLKSDALQYLEIACVKQDGRLLWRQPTAMVCLPASHP